MSALDELVSPNNEYTVGVPGIPEARAELEALRAEVENNKRYIRGGEGSHWVGCEETHWDCKIAKLEKENASLMKIIDAVGEWRQGCIPHRNCDCLRCKLLEAHDEYKKGLGK
jgi:hypothetical protein